MKKILVITLAIMAMVACDKDFDDGRLDDNFSQDMMDQLIENPQQNINGRKFYNTLTSSILCVDKFCYYYGDEYFYIGSNPIRKYEFLEDGTYYMYIMSHDESSDGASGMVWLRSKPGRYIFDSETNMLYTKGSMSSYEDSDGNFVFDDDIWDEEYTVAEVIYFVNGEYIMKGNVRMLGYVPLGYQPMEGEYILGNFKKQLLREIHDNYVDLEY